MLHHLQKLVEHLKLGGCVRELPVYEHNGEITCHLDGAVGRLLSDPNDADMQYWVWKVDPDTDTLPHFHEVDEYIHMLDGEMIDKNENRLYVKGEMAFWRAGETHHAHFTTGGEYTLVFRPSIPLVRKSVPNDSR